MGYEIDQILDKADMRGTAQQLTRDLCNAGYITVRVYTKNWRVVEIMAGPNAGDTTAPPGRRSRPYMTRPQLPNRPAPTAEPKMPAGDPPPRKRRQQRIKSVPERSFTTSARPHTAARVPVASSDFIAPITKEQLMGRR